MAAESERAQEKAYWSFLSRFCFAIAASMVAVLLGLLSAPPGQERTWAARTAAFTLPFALGVGMRLSWPGRKPAERLDRWLFYGVAFSAVSALGSVWRLVDFSAGVGFGVGLVLAAVVTWSFLSDLI